MPVQLVGAMDTQLPKGLPYLHFWTLVEVVMGAEPPRVTLVGLGPQAQEGPTLAGGQGGLGQPPMPPPPPLAGGLGLPPPLLVPSGVGGGGGGAPVGDPRAGCLRRPILAGGQGGPRLHSIPPLLPLGGGGGGVGDRALVGGKVSLWVPWLLPNRCSPT